MAEKAQPKGRGALLELLKKHKEQKAGGDKPEELPPKSRGRAALLQRLQEMKEKKVGSSSAAGSSAITETPTSSRGAVEELRRDVTQMSITPTESSSFQGKAGTPFRATCNYVYLELEQDRGVFEYEVRFNPDIDAKSNRIKLVNESLGALSTTKVYDGDTCLYLPSQSITDRQSFSSKIPHTEEPVTTTLIYKRKKKLSECLHLYNVLFKRIMNILLYTRMGRNYFSPEHRHIIPQHKLEVLPGFAVHVDEMEGGLMLCLDTQHRVIRSQTVYELLHDLRASFSRNLKEEATKSIIGSCVLTRYNNKTYIIDDIAWEMTPRDTFDTRDGSKCSFVDYYKHHHNIQINDIDQPMLINRQTKQINDKKVENMICLVPELCYLTGLTDAMRSDFKVMKDVAAYTRITPQQRALALRMYLENVAKSELAQKVLSNWGLRLANGTTELQARALPQEMIYFGAPNSEERKITSTGDWGRAISDNSLTGPIDITNWQLYFTRRDQKFASNFAETLCRLAKGMGCVIRSPQMILLEDDRNDSYVETIRTHLHDNVQVTVFICPTIRADRYAIIKKLCTIQKPTASQVILSKTLSNPQKVRSIIHKIGMQITCKLGGTLWCVKIPVRGWMSCGIDVYHGSNQSVCGFVATISESMTKYFSKAVFQSGELGDFFKTSFRDALLLYKQCTGGFPFKVVVFRDGVGDGQLEQCKRYEIPQFLEVIQELNIETTVTYVIVQKRINTRIFKMIDKNNFENPPSGTVVDSIVTRSTVQDFFLVPQSVRQGTVNPTHYIVLHNGGSIPPDHLQRLAYKLCHLYFNWTGTIRVPAPCLYAHKLASLVGQYIKISPGAELQDRLYYL